ncbi:hypothetical protein [Janthinobacterium fluminis]|uniref:DUF3325 domain-containing protein n=1 Tax=Janthinobacterium fluminis TaxID=2987524 RepID=A0ABT5K193_9BURK|nr:hypothetical protein [Janthinobacterium fluminis]MDC8758466.1 hypothetical protein [Janthinobacterium fluminis]
MSHLYLLIATLAAVCFYLASPHQHLWLGAPRHARRLRLAGWAGCLAAVGAGHVALGFWAGLFAALSALMLALLALPYLDCYRRTRNVE